MCPLAVGHIEAQAPVNVVKNSQPGIIKQRASTDGHAIVKTIDDAGAGVSTVNINGDILAPKKIPKKVQPVHRLKIQSAAEEKVVPMHQTAGGKIAQNHSRIAAVREAVVVNIAVQTGAGIARSVVAGIAIVAIVVIKGDVGGIDACSRGANVEPVVINDHVVPYDDRHVNPHVIRGAVTAGYTAVVHPISDVAAVARDRNAVARKAGAIHVVQVTNAVRDIDTDAMTRAQSCRAGEVGCAAAIQPKILSVKSSQASDHVARAPRGKYQVRQPAGTENGHGSRDAIAHEVAGRNIHGRVGRGGVQNRVVDGERVVSGPIWHGTV